MYTSYGIIFYCNNSSQGSHRRRELKKDLAEDIRSLTLKDLKLLTSV